MKTTAIRHLPLYFMASILAISAIIGLSGCHRSVDTLSPYGWEPVDEQFDSITLVLERRFLRYRDFDSAEIDIENLRRIAMDAPDDKRQIEQARYLYWKGRYIGRTVSKDSARIVMAQAVQLVDSARYPYDIHRYRWTMEEPDSAHLNGSVGWYDKIMADIAFYDSVGDCMLAGDRYLDLGTTLSDLGYDQSKCLAMIDKADSLFAIAGMTRHIADDGLNRAYIMRKSDPAAAAEILRAMLQDSIIIAQPHMLHKIYNDLYGWVGDTVALRKGYENLKNLPDNPGLECYYKSLLAQNLAKAGNLSLAEEYMYAAGRNLEYLDKSSHVSVYNALADVATRLGDHEVANLFQRRAYLALRDQQTEIAASSVMQTEFDSHLSRLEAESREASFRRTMVSIVVVFLVIIAAGIFAWIFYRRLQKQKMISISEKLTTEQAERKVLAMMLVMEEKDNMMTSLEAELNTLVKDGEVSSAATQRIRNAIKIHAGEQEDRDNFIETFTNVHPSFTKRLKEDYPALSDTEVKLAALITMGLESKHIARILAIRPESVKQARWRLRSKMKLETADNLSDILSRYK